MHSQPRSCTPGTHSIGRCFPFRQAILGISPPTARSGGVRHRKVPHWLLGESLTLSYLQMSMVIDGGGRASKAELNAKHTSNVNAHQYGSIVLPEPLFLPSLHALNPLADCTLPVNSRSRHSTPGFFLFNTHSPVGQFKVKQGQINAYTVAFFSACP